MIRRRPLLRGVAMAGAGAMAGSAIAKHNAQKQQQQAATDAPTQSQSNDLQAQQTQMPPAPEAAPSSGDFDDRIEAIQKLAGLHDSGALTDNEFAAEKARVLQG